MLSSRVLSRFSGISGRRSLLLLSSASPKQQHQLVPAICNGVQPAAHQLSPHGFKFNQSASSYFLFQNVGFASSASPEPEETNGQGKPNEDVESAAPSGDSVSGESKEAGFDSESQPTGAQPVNRRRRGTKRTAFSDSDSEDNDAAADLSRDDLLKLVVEKDELLKSKQHEFEMMQDKFLRTLADNENVMERTKREAENSKKFAIQNFAKGLLDVADNLGRASSVFKESFAKVDTSNDSAGVVPLVKSLSEGVDMTEKQLGEVFKKFGLERFDPTNEPFDPHRHNAVFQVPDASKPPGTVAHVLKAGYMLHERVVRPAEVGVTTEAVEKE